MGTSRDVILAAAVLGAVCLALSDPAVAEETRPRKIVNVKAGAGAYLLERIDGGNVCSEAVRMVGVFGVRTAHFPWMLGVDFHTSLAVEVYGGAFWPALRLGRGWIAFNGGAFVKTSTESLASDPAAGCGGGTYEEPMGTLGFGLGAEYLLYEGHLGFFVETRQSVMEPVGTHLVAGIDVSPLLWLLFRSY